MLHQPDAQTALSVMDYYNQPTNSDWELDDVIDYPAAIAVDTAASLYNSAVGIWNAVTYGDWEVEEANTEEWAYALNEDIGDFYLNHTEAVKLGSFAAGLFVPGMAVSKALNLAKAGKMGMVGKPFQIMDQNIKKNKALALDTLSKEGAHSAVVTDAMKSIKWNSIAEGAAESVVYELGIMSLYNGHTYMQEDYDATDFAIGVGLGTILGPIKYAIERHDILTKANKVQTKQEKIIAPAHSFTLQGNTAGDTLNNQVLSIEAAKNILVEQAENLSVQSKERVTTQIGEARKAIYDNVVRMSDENILGGTTTPGVEKGINITFGMSNSEDYLMWMTENQPGVFSGASNFTLFDKTTVSDSLNYVGTRVLDDGSIMAKNGDKYVKATYNRALINNEKLARKTALDNITDDVTFLKDPAGITVFTIAKGKETDKMVQNFITAKLSLPEFRDIAVQIKVEGGKSTYAKQITQKAQSQAKAATFVNEQRLYEQASTVDDLEDLVDPTATRAVIDPYLGPEMIDDVTAHLLMGAASDPKFRINSAYTLAGDSAYNPLKQSTLIVDGQFHNAMEAALKDTGQAAVNIADTNIPAIQAYILSRKNSKSSFNINLVDAKRNTVMATTDIDQATQHLLNLKIQEMKRLGMAGQSLEMQAKKVNMPMPTARKVAASGYTSLPADKVAVNQYSEITKAARESYLNQKMIRVDGEDLTKARLQENKITADLDRDIMRTTHNGIMRDIVYTSKDTGLRNLWEQLLGGPLANSIRDSLPDAMSSFAAGGVAISSTDFALRRMGKTGEHVTAFGRAFNPIVNEEIKTTVTGAKELFTPVARDIPSSVLVQEAMRSMDAIPTAEAKQLAFDAASNKIVTKFKKELDPITGEEILIPDKFLTYLDNPGKEIVLTTTPSQQLFANWKPIQDKFLNLMNANRRAVGLPLQKGRGIWFPYDAIEDAYVGYIINATNDVKLVTAPSKEIFQDKMLALKTKYPSYEQVIKPDAKSHPDIIERGKAEAYWNSMHNYGSLNNLDMADASMAKKGVAAETIDPTGARFDRVIGSLQKQLWRQYRNFTRTSMSEVFDTLEGVAKSETEYAAASTKGFLAQKVQTGLSSAELVSKTMLNASVLNKYPGLDSVNNIYTVKINQAIHSTQAAWDKATKSVKYRGVQDLDKIDFEKFNQELVDAGVPNPFKSVLEFARSQQQGVKDLAQSTIARASSVLVTANLRLLEFSHAAVTTLSTPVILSGELAHGRYPMKYMMAAAKNVIKDPDGIMLRARDRGITKAMIAETTSMMDDLVINPSSFTERSKKAVNALSFASDRAEGWAREFSYAVGYEVAKSKNKGAPMELLEAEASAFMARTMGNYVSRQRPTLFQGSFGATIGLYQTFMLTMAQNMLRFVENRDVKAFMTLMGTQGTMFGMESLPLYKPFNKLLGSYVFDDHEDISQTVYENFGNDNEQSRSVAEYMLYGLPSALTQTAFSTRAELEPRIPLTFDSTIGMSPAIVNATYQAIESGYNTAKLIATKAGAGAGIWDMNQAVLQGMASQYLWRPGARISELLLGQSFDRGGTVVANEDDVWQPWPFFSRVMGSRPLKEQAVRNLRYHANYYNTVDSNNRRGVVKALRSTISAEGSDEQVSNLMTKYLESGGTSRGWKQAMNGAYLSLETPYAERLLDRTTKLPSLSNTLDSYAF